MTVAPSSRTDAPTGQRSGRSSLALRGARSLCRSLPLRAAHRASGRRDRWSRAVPRARPASNSAKTEDTDVGCPAAALTLLSSLPARNRLKILSRAAKRRSIARSSRRVAPRTTTSHPIDAELVRLARHQDVEVAASGGAVAGARIPACEEVLADDLVQGLRDCERLDRDAWNGRRRSRARDPSTRRLQRRRPHRCRVSRHAHAVERGRVSTQGARARPWRDRQPSETRLAAVCATSPASICSSDRLVSLREDECTVRLEAPRRPASFQDDRHNESVSTRLRLRGTDMRVVRLRRLCRGRRCHVVAEAAVVCGRRPGQGGSAQQSPRVFGARAA